MTIDLIEKTEQVDVETCHHKYWNLVRLTCCMKCGETR